MTPGAHDNRADYVRRVIAARAPELSAADLAAAFGANTDLPPEVGAALIDVVEALEQKLDRIEQSVRAA